MSRELVEATTTQALVDMAVKHIAEVFDGEVFLLFPDPTRRGPVTVVPVLRRHIRSQRSRTTIWASRSGCSTMASEPAAALTHCRRRRRCSCLCGRAGQIVGILGVRPRGADRTSLFSSDQIRLLETFAGQVALAAERIRSAQDAQQAELQVEAERLRSSLLSAVSHDLRTPLAAIAGASSTLVDDDGLDATHAARVGRIDL